MVQAIGVTRSFKREGGGHNFHIFFKRIFFWGRTNSKLLEKQEKLLGVSGACSPGEILKLYLQ